jgi:hypothetical protein
MENGDALADGAPLEALTALRTHLAETLLAAEPKLAAGLSRELRAVVAEQQRLGGGREESKVDDLAAKRAERRARGRGAAGSEETPYPGLTALD